MLATLAEVDVSEREGLEHSLKGKIWRSGEKRVFLVMSSRRHEHLGQGPSKYLLSE